LKTLLVSLLLFFITACTDQSETAKKMIEPINLVAQGKALFNQKHLGKDKVIGCVLCHSIEAGQVIIGPSLAGLSQRAAHLVKGETAEQYIRNAIINPDAYIVEGFTPAVMLSNFAEALSKDEIEALVAYLMTL
jgi:cytochrome c2